MTRYDLANSSVKNIRKQFEHLNNKYRRELEKLEKIGDFNTHNHSCLSGMVYAFGSAIEIRWD